MPINPADVKVTVIGGGNAAHVLAALLPFKKFPTSLYCPFGDEAERISAGIKEQGHMLARFALHNEPSGDVCGTPLVVSRNAVDVIPGADIILLPVPSFAYPSIFKDIAPHLRPGQMIGVTPGQGGFDWVARSILPATLMDQLVLFALMPMPFNCRILEFGKVVAVQEFKRRYRVGVHPAAAVPAVVDVVEALFGHTESCGSLLASALYPINAVIHPARLITLLEGWEEGKTLDRNPLFYEELTEGGAAVMHDINVELIALGDALKRAGFVVEIPHIFDFLAKYVYQDPSSTLHHFFTTNAAYKGFGCPLKQVAADAWVPDFTSRYFTEDISLGLCVYKGVADLAGVQTPTIDRILQWAQTAMGKEYIRDCALTGADVGETNAPQRFGIATLDQLKSLY